MTDRSIVAIIPLFNGARWIEGAIRSVFAQTIPPDEFMVVDDGSTDDGPAIVEKLAQERHITLLRKPNGGQSAARNFAVARSKSALIALLDQDDRWYPNHLEVLRRKFEKHQGLPLGWAYSDFDDIDADGRVVSRMFVEERRNLQNPKRRLASLLLHGLIIQPSATLISRAAFEAVGGFDERLCGYEDDDLFLRIFRESFDNAYVPYPTRHAQILHQEAAVGLSGRSVARCLLREGRHRAAFHRNLVTNVRAGVEIPELHQNAGIRPRSLGPGSSAWHQAAEASLLNHISTVEISQTWYGDDCRWAAHSPLVEVGVSWSYSRNRRNSSALFCSRLPVRNLEIAQVERKTAL